jgi:hypothetical protein
MNIWRKIMMVNLPDMKLPVQKLGGAISSRHKLARSCPFKPAAAIPDQYITPIRKWSKWLNDQYGVCTTSEECCNIDCAWADIVDDKTMYNWCRKHGFVNGADLPEVMEAMVSDPIGGTYSDGDYFSVDWTDEAVLRAAIYESQSSVKIAIAADQLRPTAAGESQGWVLTGARKDRSIDHCVGLVGYGTAKFILESLGAKVPSTLDPNKKGYCMFTWGTLGFIDQASLDAITGEAYVRKPSSLKNGKTPTPVNPPPPPTPIPDPPTPFDWVALINLIMKIIEAFMKKDKK